MRAPTQCTRRSLWIALIAAAVCGLLLVPLNGRARQSQGQPQPPSNPSSGSPPAPTFKGGINFVRVDVRVTDKTGDPIVDLKPSDFQVREDGKLQTIQSVQFISIDRLQPAGPEPPAPITTPEEQRAAVAADDDVRLVAIFLDDYHVDAGESMAVRAQIEKFIERDLAPSDLVGIMYPLTPVADVVFSRDHEEAEQEIEHFLGRKYNYSPRNDLEKRYADYPTAVVEQIRNHVSLSAIKGLVTHLGSLREGRKAVLLVSEGYSDYLPPQLRDPVATAPEVGNPNVTNPAAGDNPNEEAARFLSAMDMDEDLRDVYSAADRDNTSIYALDPLGLATFAFGADHPAVDPQLDQRLLSQMQDTLRVLADETDGRAIINQNDMSGGLAQLARDLNDYYLIGYVSSAPSDGKFHPIKVSVTRPGVTVRARRGYWALTPEEMTSATAPAPKAAPARPEPDPAVKQALASLEAPARHDVVNVWVGMSRGDGGSSRVRFVWQPVARTYGEDARSSQQPARVLLTAIGRDGAPYFRGTLKRSATADTAAQAIFEAAPGPMTLQLSVQAADGQALDVNDLAVHVPDFTRPQVSISTPALFVARSAYELHQLTTAADAVPTPARQFSRTDTLLIECQAYAPGGSQPAVTASLLNRGGSSVAALSVRQWRTGARIGSRCRWRRFPWVSTSSRSPPPAAARTRARWWRSEW